MAKRRDADSIAFESLSNLIGKTFDDTTQILDMVETYYRVSDITPPETYDQFKTQFLEYLIMLERQAWKVYMNIESGSTLTESYQEGLNHGHLQHDDTNQGS